MLDGKEKISILNKNCHEFPVVVSIPHSGICFPKNVIDSLRDDVVLASMDWYLPDLYSFFEELGVTIIVNNVSRYVIDPNREINFDPKDDSYINNFIYSKSTFGDVLYKKELSLADINHRIDSFYKPYHKMLNETLMEKLKYFDKVYLIDLHSFGSNVFADIVLGNDDGKTTSDVFFDLVKRKLEKENFVVKENVPFRGGYITRHYGNSLEGCEALQIELSYGVYIANREFGKEAFPVIDKDVFLDGQKRMKSFFDNLLKEIKLLNDGEVLNEE